MCLSLRSCLCLEQRNFDGLSLTLPLMLQAVMFLFLSNQVLSRTVCITFELHSKPVRINLAGRGEPFVRWWNMWKKHCRVIWVLPKHETKSDKVVSAAPFATGDFRSCVGNCQAHLQAGHYLNCQILGEAEKVWSILFLTLCRRQNIPGELQNHKASSTWTRDCT